MTPHNFTPFLVRMVSCVVAATLTSKILFQRWQKKLPRQRRRGYYILVGSYTEPLMADPFAGVGGVPHDATKVGKGIYVLYSIDSLPIQALRSSQ